MTISTDRDWGREGIGTSSAVSRYDTMGIRLEGIESGPSRLFSPSSSTKEGMCDCEICMEEARPVTQTQIRQRKTRRSASTLTLSSVFLPTLFLPFLPHTSAAPAPAPPPTRIRRLTPRSPTSTIVSSSAISSHQPTSSSSSFDEHRKIQYLTSASTPSILPTDNAYVDETVLPYLLTKNEDGHWRRAEGGWSIYGRQVAMPTAGPIFADDGTGSTDTAEPSVKAPSYAVESVLPNGWGVSSNRTSIYKVPLISIASVIMATGIVALIVFIVISRRKRHRKRKRAKERLRRKALAAAGIKEEDLKSNVTENKFKEKLKELENQHSSKKKKNGQIGFAKNKVRVWNQRLGLRKRKIKSGQKDLNDEDEDGVRISGDNDQNGDRQAGEINDEEEDKPVEGVDPIQPSSPTSILNQNGENEEEETGSRRSSTDSTRGSGEGGNAVQLIPGTEGGPSSNGESSRTAQTTIPHFPPAYRPASVRSLPRRNASSSSSAGPSSSHPVITDHDHPTVLSGAEKTQAPGYYPAPATEDGEIALAVVSRSEGKSRLVEPPSTLTEEEEEREERVRHIATDDKRVLERLRLGASAPPVIPSEPQEEDEGNIGEGPSAPIVQVDDQGFEQLDESHLHVPLDAPVESQADLTGVVLPAPPRLNARLSSRLNDIPTSPVPTNVEHLLPSAPPSAPVAISDNLPSAPPMLEDEIEDSSSAPSAPSAPVFDIGEDEEEGDNDSDNSPSSQSRLNEVDESSHQHADEVEQLVEEDEEHRDSQSTFLNALPTRSGPGSTPNFLPRYEP